MQSQKQQRQDLLAMIDEQVAGILDHQKLAPQITSQPVETTPKKPKPFTSKRSTTRPVVLATR